MSLVEQLRAQGLKSPEEYQAHVEEIKARLQKSSVDYRVEEVNNSLNQTAAELSTAMTLLP